MSKKRRSHRGHRQARRNPEGGWGRAFKRLVGGAIGGAAFAIAASVGLSYASGTLSNTVQDLILMGAGLAVGAACFAFDKQGSAIDWPSLGVGVFAGSASLAGLRMSLRVAEDARVQGLINSARAAVGLPAGTAPAASTPATASTPAAGTTPPAGLPWGPYAPAGGFNFGSGYAPMGQEGVFVG